MEDTIRLTEYSHGAGGGGLLVAVEPEGQAALEELFAQAGLNLASIGDSLPHTGHGPRIEVC